MATYSSKPEKSQASVDPILVFVSVMLIGTLVIFGPLHINVTSSARSAAYHLAPSTVVSFAADEQYWAAHCSHGWNSDFTCENIVSRAQACYTGFAGFTSTYCTEYNSYLKQFQNRLLVIYQ